MTFTARPVAPFKVDILSAGEPSSLVVGQQIPCTGSPTETSATVSGGQITLPAGSHWRIEYSACFAGDSSGDCSFEIGFYSFSSLGFIGHSLYGSSDGYNPTRMGRCVATLLLLNSQITTSTTIEARIIAQTAMTSGLPYSYIGKAGFRIMELPA